MSDKNNHETLFKAKHTKLHTISFINNHLFLRAMPITQEMSRRKSSGGRYKSVLFKKKRGQKGSSPINTILGERRVKKQKALGNNVKTRIFFENKVSVYDPQTKKTAVEEITKILENPANPQFVRRNIITKGAIIETQKGKVKITSRPGQEGSLSGIRI